MIQRCSTTDRDRPTYRRYAGRGITVCDRWLRSFENFLEDMGYPAKGQSLDRIDNNGNYEPGNCRWATNAEQHRNMCNNVILTHNGESLCVTDWADKLGVKANTLFVRLKRGWPVPKVLNTKIGK